MEQAKRVKMDRSGVIFPASNGGMDIEHENGPGRRRPLPTPMNGTGTWGEVVKPPGPVPFMGVGSNGSSSSSSSSSCCCYEVSSPVEEGGVEGVKQKTQQLVKNHGIMQKGGGRIIETKRNGSSENENDKGGLQVMAGVRKIGDGGIKRGSSTGGEKDDNGGQSIEAIDPFTLAMVASILQSVSHGPKTEPELRKQLMLDLECCRGKIPSLADIIGSDGKVAQHVPIQGELLEVRLIIDILQALGIVRSEFVEVSYGGGPEDLHPEPLATAPICTCRRIMGAASLMLGVEFAPALPADSRSSSSLSRGGQKALRGLSAVPTSSGYSKPTVKMRSLEPSPSASPRLPHPPAYGIRNKSEVEKHVQSLEAIALGQGAFRLLQSVEDRSTAYASLLAIRPFTSNSRNSNGNKDSTIDREEEARKASSEAAELGMRQLSSLSSQPNNSVNELPIAVKQLAMEGMFDHIRSLFGDVVCKDAAIYVASLLDSAPLDSHAFELALHGDLRNKEIVEAVYGHAVFETLTLWIRRRTTMEEDECQMKNIGSGNNRGRNVGEGGTYRKTKTLVVPQAHQLHPKIKLAVGNDSSSTVTATATPSGKRVVRFRLDPAQDRVLTDWKGPSAQLAKLDDEAARLALYEELLLRQLLSRVGTLLPAGYSRVHCIDALRSSKPHAYSEGKRSAPAIKRARSMGLSTGVGGGGAALRGSGRVWTGMAPSLSQGGMVDNNTMQQKATNFQLALDDIGISSPVATTPSSSSTKKEAAGVDGDEKIGSTSENVDLHRNIGSPTATGLSSQGVRRSPCGTVCKESKDAEATTPVMELPCRTAAQLWGAVHSNLPFRCVQTHKDVCQSGSGGESGLLGVISSTGRMSGHETGGLGLFLPATSTPSYRKRRLSSSGAAFVVPGNPDVPPLRCGFHQWEKSDGFQGRRRGTNASNTPRGSAASPRDRDGDRTSPHSSGCPETERPKPKWRSGAEDTAIRTKSTPWSLVCSMLTDITDEGTPVTPTLAATTSSIGRHGDNKEGEKLDNNKTNDSRRLNCASDQPVHSPNVARLMQRTLHSTSPSLEIHAPKFRRLQESELVERVAAVEDVEDHEDTSDEAYKRRHLASLGIMKEKIDASKKARSSASATVRPAKKRSKSVSWFKSKNPPPPA